jgi:hypothetical protein
MLGQENDAYSPDPRTAAGELAAAHGLAIIDGEDLGGEQGGRHYRALSAVDSPERNLVRWIFVYRTYSAGYRAIFGHRDRRARREA